MGMMLRLHEDDRCHCKGVAKVHLVLLHGGQVGQA